VRQKPVEKQQMPNAAVMFTILPVSAVVALLVTVAIAYFLGRRLKQQLLAILIAGFALPVAMMLAALYAVSTDQPDWASTGHGAVGGPVCRGGCNPNHIDFERISGAASTAIILFLDVRFDPIPCQKTTV